MKIENKNFITKKLSFDEVIEIVKEILENYEVEAVEEIAIEIWNELSELKNS